MKFLGQTDDIDKIQYREASKISPLTARPKDRHLARQRSVFIHEQPNEYLQPGAIIARTTHSPMAFLPQKQLPKPLWPVQEIITPKSPAKMTTRITSIFHNEEEKILNIRRESNPRNYGSTDVRSYTVRFMESDAARDDDLYAGNNRRQVGRGNNPGQGRRGRRPNNPPVLNNPPVRRNPQREQQPHNLPAQNNPPVPNNPQGSSGMGSTSTTWRGSATRRTTSTAKRSTRSNRTTTWTSTTAGTSTWSSNRPRHSRNTK